MSPTSHSELALQFAADLTRSDWVGAHRRLDVELAEQVQPTDLESAFDQMTSYGQGPWTVAGVDSTLDDWPTRRSADLGWAYVSLIGDGFVEAIAVVVTATPLGNRIREIEWGRP